MTAATDRVGSVATGRPIRRGALHCIGLGPGDPELVTLRAQRILSAADVVAHFAKAGRRGIARSIADAVAGPSRAELAFAYPFTDEVPVEDPSYATRMGAFYDDCADRLASHLAGGAVAALLCDGDPFLYGSTMHLYRRLVGRFPIEVVPGVTGMSGCWSRAGLPMTWGDDTLTVLPGTLPSDQLVRRLADCEAAVIMKLGSGFGRVRAAMMAAGVADRAIYVERGTMEGERICPLSDLPADHRAPYFALILVPGQGRRP